MTEAQLHKAVAQYLDLALPADAVWHHSPMGGKRPKGEAGKLKSMGARAGWPDITIIWQGRAYFIELKVGDRTLSVAQMDTIGQLRRAGAEVALSRSLAVVTNILTAWGIPLKARAA